MPTNKRSGSLRVLTLYPTFVMYLAAICTVSAMALSGFSLRDSIVVLSIVAVLVVLVSLTHEVRVVHRLLSAQRRELLAHIDHLTRALEQAGLKEGEADV